MNTWILKRYLYNERFTLGILKREIKDIKKEKQVKEIKEIKEIKEKESNNNIFFYTLELSYRNNQPFKSCIPEGEYKLIPHTSPKFKKCLKIKEVNNRTNILIHTGNATKDTTGCILIGNNTNNNGIIGESRKALNELLEMIKKEVILKIC